MKASILSLSKLGGLFTVLLISLSASANGLQGKIQGFKLSSCGIKNCLVIKSSQAFAGLLSSNYAFDSAVIEITDKQTTQKTSLASSDTFYDGKSQKIYIRNIDQHKNTEAIYDLKTEKLTFYSNQ